MIEIINGNLLDSEEKFIAHQVNVTSTTWSGVAKAIFDKYPYANTYRNRMAGYNPNPQHLGTIEIFGDGADNRFIINMNAQMYPGKSGFGHDTKEKRELYFKSCLDSILNIKDLESIAFPYFIGCGLGGGNWNTYYKMLEDFAQQAQAKVVLYKIGS